jgi:cyclopropane fatty-acyl-phospholipid synthase-like methyltransferase
LVVDVAGSIEGIVAQAISKPSISKESTMSCVNAKSTVVLQENEQAANVWNSGGRHYDRISRQIADAIEHCVDRLGPQAGDNVLDVATGTGWTARRIAARGAKVTGVDISSTALDSPVCQSR